MGGILILTFCGKCSATTGGEGLILPSQGTGDLLLFGVSSIQKS